MSTLFNLRPQFQGKQVSIHPWEKTIKDIYSNRIKHAHNSIKNPHYPRRKEKAPDADCVKFTVIGDRITKEFIYCATLVKGLHKYRWKKFGVPVIRGVTSVEWPKVWRSLKIEHGGIAHCIQSRVVVLLDEKILGGEKELKELVESKYIYHLKIDYNNEAIKQFAIYIRSSGRPCAFMHISIDDEPVGTMIFMLYADIVPYTCENFLRLCNETKGGYSGTPIHRIVKDGWIQGGGFGLKSSSLDCENFIIPHDRRGVLCMANDGRHIDCSTQFFILLQPAPWMEHKYVAFGQLIEGENTLEKIEKVPTWYESPSSNIIIYKAGIFNMECQDITINKKTNEYLHGHVEDLNVLGELLIEALFVRVFLQIKLNSVEKLENDLLLEEEVVSGGAESGIHATKRSVVILRPKMKCRPCPVITLTTFPFNPKHSELFHGRNRKSCGSFQDDTHGTPMDPTPMPSKIIEFIRKKEEIDKQLEGQTNARQSFRSQGEKSLEGDFENNDFDVEEYELESPYQHQSLVSSSLVLKPERPFNIPLTDVLYPGEVDSIYDLKKFLKGDYCLESDLDRNAPKNPAEAKTISYAADLISIYNDSDDSTSYLSLESEEEKEIRQYLQMNVDRVSFAGSVVKGISRGIAKYNLLENERKSQLVDDETLRRIRIASMEMKNDLQNKKVSISVPNADKGVHSKIKRRQTGFVRPADLENIRIFRKSTEEVDEHMMGDDEAQKAVRIDPCAITSGILSRPIRRPTGFVRISNRILSEMNMDDKNLRHSVLHRLYEDVSYMDSNGPTLKDYKPLSESEPRHMLFMTTPNSQIRNEDGSKEKFLRYSMTKEELSFENVLNLQHNKKIARKISSDYVKTIDQMGHKFENSIRSIEYAKSRPSMTVSAYQLKNSKHQAVSKSNLEVAKQSDRKLEKGSSTKGIRLPGDTPAYSLTSNSVEIE